MKKLGEIADVFVVFVLTAFGSRARARAVMIDRVFVTAIGGLFALVAILVAA